VRFDGGVGLASSVAAEPAFARCLVKNLYVYAMAQGADGAADQDQVARLAEGFASSGHKLGSLISTLVTSDMFRSRRPDAD
jgi:hypothetical protein